MSLAEQYEIQYNRACMLLRCGVHTVSLAVVRYKDENPRVSIIGATINVAAIECWRQQGATVNIIDVITRENP